VDAPIISAPAACTGAAVGGLTSGIANWLNHRTQVDLLREFSEACRDEFDEMRA
jgi:hypothetical protein